MCWCERDGVRDGEAMRVCVCWCEMESEAVRVGVLV